jgi:hypothetical protein
MPIRSDKNLYPGVNAHFNSFLQQNGGVWESFHARLINGLADQLDEVLPANYYALTEKSLQITSLPLIESQQRVRPDVSILRTSSSAPRSGSALVADAPFAVVPALDVSSEEDAAPLAVLVYRTSAGQATGVLVTRIEVLFPANKPPGSDYRHYRTQRRKVMQAGVNLVEIDLLHEQRPVVSSFPSYADGESDYPYLIATTSPDGSMQGGQTQLYGIRVLDCLPRVALPLTNEDQVVVDFAEVYAATFQRFHRLAQMVIDYAQEPSNFDRYHPEDRERIRTLLATIRAEHTATED